MKNNSTHNNWEDEEQFFKNVKPPFKESAADIWSKMESQLEDNEGKDIKVKKNNAKGLKVWVRRLSIAAMLMLAGLFGFARFYTTTIETTTGQLLSHSLPDGSTIELSGNSQLSYAPYWWSFDRTIHFEGVGFFEVEKGRKFSVESQRGSTHVLGTSFNINTQKTNSYQVTCVTGKVMVKTGAEETILQPNEQVIWNHPAQQATKITAVKTQDILAWKNKQLTFSGITLESFVHTLEERYGVDIQLDVSTALKAEKSTFTQPFSEKATIEEVLELVSSLLSIKFEKTGNRQYRIME